jgi:hypothetical protein
VVGFHECGRLSNARRFSALGRLEILHLTVDCGTAGGWDRDGAPLDPARLLPSPKLRTRFARWWA